MFLKKPHQYCNYFFGMTKGNAFLLDLIMTIMGFVNQEIALFLPVIAKTIGREQMWFNTLITYTCTPRDTIFTV